MANYKTPGVYIEEISKFPPSVAQVETAIPAFIGYTEKAERLNGDTLHLDPTRITSLLEYETYFGAASSETSIQVEMTDVVEDGKVVDRTIKVQQPTDKKPFLMYYSMQLYFANGGGPCYITSVGRYGDKAGVDKKSVVNLGELEGGLSVIRKEDEPTLLLFPDATNLASDSDFWGIYDQALQQCNNLQDRFSIIDTYRDVDYTETSSSELVSPEEGLRNGITLGKDYLKYAAAYYPFLETILNYQYDESDVILKHYSVNADAYDEIAENIGDIENAVTGLPSFVDELHTEVANIATLPTNVDISGSISDVLKFMYDDMDLGGTFSTDDAKKTAFQDAVELLNEDLGSLVDFKSQLNAEANAAASTVSDEKPAIETAILAKLDTFNADFEGENKIEEIHGNLVDLLGKMQKAKSTDKQEKLMNVEAVNFDTELQKLLIYADFKLRVDVVSASLNLLVNIKSNMTDLIDNGIKLVEGEDKNNGVYNGRSLSALEEEDNAAYNTIKVEIDALPMTLPPSSAMAGIYARVDASRGVWKAPANVGLSYVIKPTVQISHEEQGGLNVDTVAGKSINAIRTFTGKGTLVWGARTLAGNDNEWRYINVRRFFNMVEESVGKATEQFVFEGNDANTWVRVRAMIENFLILQWKAGALAGAKAEQAFYVRVGLGQTMTAQDILEGRMIIEIGMAAVRPAEFIILRFSHKMQEA